MHSIMVTDCWTVIVSKSVDDAHGESLCGH
jgi:hypothetical protein